MAKIIAILMFNMALASPHAFASGVSACSEDELTQENINEIDPGYRVDLTNAKGELVGAIHFSEALPSDDMEALYLCGANSGYYYIRGSLSEWVTQPGETITIAEIYNDEYEVDASAQTLVNNKDEVRLKLNFKVKFEGDPNDADWEPFRAEVFATFPALGK